MWSLLMFQVSPDQMIQAQGPLEVYHKFHEKFCLIVGQGKIVEIAREYPFTVTKQIISTQVRDMPVSFTGVFPKIHTVYKLRTLFAGS